MEQEKERRDTKCQEKYLVRAWSACKVVKETIYRECFKRRQLWVWRFIGVWRWWKWLGKIYKRVECKRDRYVGWLVFGGVWGPCQLRRDDISKCSRIIWGSQPKVYITINYKYTLIALENIGFQTSKSNGSCLGYGGSLPLVNSSTNYLVVILLNTTCF